MLGVKGYERHKETSSKVMMLSYLLLTLVIMNIYDCWSTIELIKLGAFEVNPLSNYLLSNGLLVPAKILVTTLLLACSALTMKYKDPFVQKQILPRSLNCSSRKRHILRNSVLQQYVWSAFLINLLSNVYQV